MIVSTDRTFCNCSWQIATPKNLRFGKRPTDKCIGKRTLPNSSKAEDCNLAMDELGILVFHSLLL